MYEWFVVRAGFQSNISLCSWLFPQCKPCSHAYCNTTNGVRYYIYVEQFRFWTFLKSRSCWVVRRRVKKGWREFGMVSWKHARLKKAMVWFTVRVRLERGTWMVSHECVCTFVWGRWWVCASIATRFPGRGNILQKTHRTLRPASAFMLLPKGIKSQISSYDSRSLMFLKEETSKYGWMVSCFIGGKFRQFRPHWLKVGATLG